MADRVLVSLAHAAAGTKDAVPYEEIVIESWRQFPERFSLRGHPEHPDSEDQNPALYGRLVPSGLVVALGGKTFRLTDDGLAQARALDDALSGRDTGSMQAKLSRVEERLLKSALESDAFGKWQDRRADELVDFDARMFFGITATTSTEGRLTRVQAMLDMAKAADEAGHAEGAEIKDLAMHLAQHFPEVTGAFPLKNGAEQHG